MSILKWLTGGLAGGDAATNARLDAELAELYHHLGPLVRAGSLGSLAVTSAEPREGRTRTAILIAEILADSLDERILLVDADGVRPALDRIYGLDNAAGLAQVLAGEAELGAAVKSTVREKLDVLTSGGPLDLTLLSRAALDELMRAVRTDYKVAVFDTAPLLVGQEAGVVCHSVAGVVMVMLAGVTQGEMLARAHRMMQRTQAKLIGVVVTDPRDEFTRES
ncbi:MAG: CpsD/CapB family tyrosine-protein kinase [Armatimonadetes bacterium]|nr:CpsD/CapB family tyrosine-protein kinase [Armatimonadota bacterium]